MPEEHMMNAKFGCTLSSQSKGLWVFVLNPPQITYISYKTSKKTESRYASQSQSAKTAARYEWLFFSLSPWGSSAWALEAKRRDCSWRQRSRASFSSSPSGWKPLHWDFIPDKTGMGNIWCWCKTSTLFPVKKCVSNMYPGIGIL